MRVTAGGFVQTAEVRSGGSYLSQSDLRLHFGLGGAVKVDKIEIAWPGGGTADRKRSTSRSSHRDPRTLKGTARRSGPLFLALDSFASGLEHQPERELQVALSSRHAAGDHSEVAVPTESLGIAQAHVRLAEHREVAEIDGLRTELNIEPAP